MDRLRLINHRNLSKYQSLSRPTKQQMSAKVVVPSKGTLNDYKQLTGYMSESEILKIIGQITEGVKELHSKHIIHMALCPTNIHMFENEGKLEVKLAMFGVNKVCEPVISVSEFLPKNTKSIVK